MSIGGLFFTGHSVYYGVTERRVVVRLT